MNYVYKKTEPGLWTVGFYEPEGPWVPESDHETSELAAARCAMLNGTRMDVAVGSIYPSRREIAIDMMKWLLSRKAGVFESEVDTMAKDAWLLADAFLQHEGVR